MIALNPLSFRIFTVYLNRALCIFAVCAAACTRPRRHGTDIAQLTLVRNTCRDAKCHATIPIQCDSMRRRQERLVASGRFSQQMIGRSENRARSSQGSPTTNFVREWLLLGPESRNPQHVDAELPQMLLRRRLDTTVTLHMRAFLQGHMQLRAEDTAASKKLCTAVFCPVLKSYTFAAETAEALATETAAMEMRAG